MPPPAPGRSSLCRACAHATRPAAACPPRRRTARRPYSTGPPPDIYDIVCVGGGPAGLSLLAALRASPITAPLRMALVEAQPLAPLRAFDPSPTAFSNRCSSLTPGSVRFLRSIGAWSHLRADRVTAYHEMQVWDGVSDARIEFEMGAGAGGAGSADDPSVIAYMVENVNLTAGLLSRLDELAGVEMHDGARVESIRLGRDMAAEGGPDLSAWPVVHLSTGRSLHARLLVGADGAASPVRAFAGIEARGWDYDRHGVVATLEHDAGDGDDEPAILPPARRRLAYQRFLPTGPVAVLPMPGRYSTLVWSTTPANAAVLRALSAEDLVATVNAAFRLRPVDLAYMHTIPSGQAAEYDWRLQHTPVSEVARHLPRPVVAVHPGTVASFPLRLRHADRYTHHRVALVGDAAHTVHPLAGQGLNQGQADVASLARCVEDAVAHGLDPGAILSLEPYPADRYAANHMLMGVCDKLHKIYSVGAGPLVPLRSWGLQAVNALAPLKAILMQQAAGGASRLF